jgi:hypothetical protein
LLIKLVITRRWSRRDGVNRGVMRYAARSPARRVSESAFKPKS